MTKQQRNGRGRALGVTLFFLFGVIIVYHALLSFSYSVGPNYRNVSVDTRVNIINALPEILAITCENPITLEAGTTHVVECNVSIRDWNGGDTIKNVSAVFYDANVATVSSPDDNNDHYTNASCQNVSVNGYYANFSCNFSVWYYANAGSNWTINVTVVDGYSFNSIVGNNDTAVNTTTINQLLALNVTSLIDYGDMAVGDTTLVGKEANVTNFGNWDINISVKGYGAVEGDGLAFVCDVGNISIENEKFSLNQTGDYTADYTALSTTFQLIPGLTLPQQTNDAQQVVNSTYWKLYVPPNPFGICNGTVVFQAEAAH